MEPSIYPAEAALIALCNQQRIWRAITDGWTFDSWIDVVDDDGTKKMEHSATDPFGQTHIVYWSPYSRPDEEDRALLIAVRFGKGPNGNWRKEDLRREVSPYASIASATHAGGCAV